MAADPDLQSYLPLTFDYWTPRLRINRLRRIPDFDVIARSLDTFLEVEAREFERVVLVSHSQGGLIVQRYLAQSVEAGRAERLAKLARVVMFACPNSGADMALLFRKSLKSWRHPQERELRPLSQSVLDTQRTILERIVFATHNGPGHRQIPIVAYAAESDGIVTPSSALGAFTLSGVLPGDHFTIIRASERSDRTYQTLRSNLLAAQTTPSSPEREVPAFKSQQAIVARSTHVRHNLPSRSAFFGREVEVQRALDGIESALPVTALEGLGGMGKSAIARRVAWDLVTGAVGDSPRFSGIVWCGEALGSLTLDMLLDEVARVLNYPYIRALSMPDKEDRVIDLVGDNPSLLVIDGLDSVTDVRVHSFIARIPTPTSKVLVTSRHRFPGDAWTVHVGGLDESSGIALIKNELMRLDVQEYDQTLLSRFYACAGGNPLAIRLTAGQAHDEGVPLEQLIDDLLEAAEGDVFSLIFARTRADLSENAEESWRVLSAIALHPGGVSREAVAYVAGVEGRTLRKAIRHLVELSLIDPQQAGSSKLVRFEAHTLTRAYVRREILATASGLSGFEERLVAYYLKYAVDHADTYASAQNVQRLEAERINIVASADMAFVHAQVDGIEASWRRVLQFADALSAFLWGRGYWRDKVRLSEQALVAAGALGDALSKARHHVLLGRVQLSLGNAARARYHLEQSEAALPASASARERVPTLRLKAQIASAHGDGETAETLLEMILEVAARTADDEGRAATLVELGIAAERQSNFELAARRFQEALDLDDEMETVEGSAVSLSHLANARFELGDYPEARAAFERGLSLARSVDRLSTIGRCQLGLARVLSLQGDPVYARECAQAAEDSFVRLGMKDMADEARLVQAALGERIRGAETEVLGTIVRLSCRGVIFDCDDTIIATARNRWSVLIRTAARFGEVIEEETIREAWGLPFNELIQAIVPELEFTEFVKEYRGAMRSQRPEATPGAIRLLMELKSAGIPMRIVTSSSRDLIVQDLDELTLTDYFVDIYGYEDTEFHKPDPRVLDAPVEAFAAHGIGRSELVYIGDSVRDYEVARRQEVPFIAVLSGLEPEEVFLDAGVRKDRIVDSLERLGLAVA